MKATCTATCPRDAARDRAFQAEFRPLVDAAWRNHAGLMGLSCQDRVERDSWYRDNLAAAARVKSTKGISDHARRSILVWFRKLTNVQPRRATAQSLPVAVWSSAQRQAFTLLAQAAHADAVARGESTPEQLLEWLEARMAETFDGRISTIVRDGVFRLGSRTEGFDAAMGCLAVIAGDRRWMERTAAGVETRLRWQLARFLVDLAWLEGKPVAWSYVVGIHAQAHASLPADDRDCTAPQLWAILQMLDTQARRLCARFGIRPCMCPTREPVDLALRIEWRHLHGSTPGRFRSPSGALLTPASP